MAQPYRCTVTIDGTKFDAVSTSVAFNTQTDSNGMPLMGSLNTEQMKIEFWKDESKQDALVSYSFNGWVQRFETLNPSDVTANLNLGLSNDDSKFQGIAPQLNHMLILGLQPAMNQQNFGSITQTN
jgi:hypothetical protein